MFAWDPVEPWIVALQRVAKGRRLHEWFWPQLDPRLATERSPAAVARVVWEALASRPDAVAGVPAAVGCLLEDGTLDSIVLEAVEPTLAARLATVVGSPQPGHADVFAILDALVPARWRASVEAVLDGPHRLRATAWVVAAAARADDPRLPVTGLATVARGRLVELRKNEVASDAADVGEPTPRERIDEPTATSPSSASEPSPDVAAPTSRPRPDHAAAAGAADEQSSQPRVPDSPSPVRSTTREPTPHPDPSRRWSLDVRPRPTDWGGLFFLVFPLRRLGLAKLLEQEPELDDGAFGARVLARVADRLEIDLEDPIRTPLDPPPRPDETLDARALAWVESVEAWLDEHAELTLAEVVRRSAAVTCTRTHVDIVFDMEASDIVIRRAGLDVDPGWVPWLGRVVSFHYVFGGMLDG